MSEARYDRHEAVAIHLAEAQRIRTEQRELDGVFEAILKEAQEILRLRNLDVLEKLERQG